VKFRATLLVGMAAAFCAWPAFGDELKRPLLDINSDQVSRIFQLGNSQTADPKPYSHRCQIDPSDGIYDCIDKLGGVVILYYSPKQGDNITNMAFGGPPDQFRNAAVYASGMILLASRKLKIKDSDAKKQKLLTDIMSKTYSAYQSAYLNSMDMVVVGEANALFTRNDPDVILHLSPPPTP